MRCHGQEPRAALATSRWRGSFAPLWKKPAGCHRLEHALAARLGLSRQAVHRIWRAFGLQPHRQEVFTLSKVPLLYRQGSLRGGALGTPRTLWCLVWTKRAKSRPSSAASPSCQCVRVAPSVGAMTTIGTVPLRSSPLWNVATGRIIGATKSRHRSQEFLSFLGQIEREVACDLDVHLILDNYATHKTAEVARWLKEQTSLASSLLPTHSSWLNQVERFFAQITSRRIR